MRWLTLNRPAGAERLDAVLTHLRPMRTLPRPIARRTLMLLHAVDLWANDELSLEIAPGLARLAAQPWRRPVDGWRGGDDPVRSLVDHLLVGVRYPLPAFLYGAALVSADRFVRWTDPDATRAMRVLAAVGDGRGLRELRGTLLPHTLTRKACHVLWTLEGAHAFTPAMRLAQVLAAGGPPWLAEAVAASLLRDPNPGEAWWQRALQWLCDDLSGLLAVNVAPLVDFLDAQRADGRAPPVRRSLGAVVREMGAWHDALGRHRGVGRRLSVRYTAFRKSGIATDPVERGGSAWTLSEIRKMTDLAEEGAKMRHCVITYASRIASGASAIFSLRRDGERCLTVQVLVARRHIVQARGLRNRHPTEEEKAVLRLWAAAAGLFFRGW